MTDIAIRVAVVEDQWLVREGLRALIAGTAGFEVVGLFGTLDDALAGLPKNPPDVMLVDIGLPGISGIEGVRRIRALHASVQILVLTLNDTDEQVFQAVCAGACGYLLKGTAPARLLEAIGEVMRGGAPMSPEIARKVVSMLWRVPTPSPSGRLSWRETEILRLLADGHSYKTSANTLGISLDTVRFHVRNIYQRLQVHSKSQAVLRALRAGLID